MHATSRSISLRRATRFAVTGGLATCIHVVVASLWFNCVHPQPAHSNGVAFITATLVGLVINTYWSFSGRLTRAVAARYIIVAAIGLLVSMGLSQAVHLAGLAYWYGIALVVLVMPIFSFLLNHYWIYRNSVPLES